MCQTQSRYFCKRHETSIRGRHAIDDEQRSEEVQKRSAFLRENQDKTCVLANCHS